MNSRRSNLSNWQYASTCKQGGKCPSPDALMATEIPAGATAGRGFGGEMKLSKGNPSFRHSRSILRYAWDF